MIGSISIPSAVLFLSMATSSLSAPVVPFFFNLGDIFTCLAPPAPTGPATGTCDNGGIAYAIQHHHFENNGVEFSNLDVPYFYTATPEQPGTTRRVGFTCSNNPADPCHIYGATFPSPETLAVNHRAYFIPKVTGMHTIYSSNADDVYFLWLGENAKKGYTKDNADCTASVGQPEKTCSAFLLEGRWYPMRILLVNGLGPTAFTFSVTGPEGLIMSDTSDYEGNYFAQFSCDGSQPRFLPFGHEE